MPGAAPLQVEFLEPVAQRPALERQDALPILALPRGQHGARVALERRARDERRCDPCALALLLAIDVEAQVVRLEARAPVELDHAGVHAVMGERVGLRQARQRGRVRPLLRPDRVETFADPFGDAIRVGVAARTGEDAPHVERALVHPEGIDETAYRSRAAHNAVVRAVPFDNSIGAGYAGRSGEGAPHVEIAAVRRKGLDVIGQRRRAPHNAPGRAVPFGNAIGAGNAGRIGELAPDVELVVVHSEGSRVKVERSCAPHNAVGGAVPFHNPIGDSAARSGEEAPDVELALVHREGIDGTVQRRAAHSAPGGGGVFKFGEIGHRRVGAELYAGGDFTKIGTNTAMANFAKFKDSTSTWSAVGSPALNGTVYALAVYKGELYVGGLFTTAGGAVADRIMKWNGSAYSIVGSTTPLNLNPTALGVYNNELYIGGQFTNAAGITGANSIAKWNGTTWSIVGSPSALANNVQALAAYCGDLYVGGTFTTAAGIPGADRIVKWDGTNYSIVGGATAISSFVNALGVYKGSLYVGGIFTSAGGNTNANGIAEWVGKCFYTVGTQEGPNAPSLARLTQAYALAHDGVDTRVVELHWRTSCEADHLGFHIYREEQGQRTRITPALIAGSALKGHAGTVLTAGQSYSWWDVLPLKSGSLRYWLEELDLKGRRTWHGPIDVKSAKGSRLAAQPERVRTVLLTRLGRGHASVTAAPWYGPREAATALPTEEQLAVQWELAASFALKLGVQAEGWYRVSQAELVAAGLDSRVDPRRLQLFADGVEVPLLVIGEQDGRFGPLDAIEFYGLGLDTPWTDTRTYWLVAGSQAGKRVGWVPSRQTGALAPLSFPQTLDWRPRLDYWAAILNGEADNFFGPLVSTEPVDQDLLVTQLDPAAPGEARIEVTLQGVTDVPHHVVVQLNGRPVGTVTWRGQTQGTTAISLPQAYLQAGANRLTLVAEGGDMDYSVVTVVRLTYWHLYQAEGDVLEAAAHGGEEVTIRGFSSAQIRVVDVTQPDAVLAVEGRVKRDRSGYAVTVVAPGSGNRILLAFVEGRQARAASLHLNHPSQWHVSGHGADLVILTHASLLPSLVHLN